MKIKPIYIRFTFYLLLIITLFCLQTGHYLPLIYGYTYNLLPTFVVALAITVSLNEAVIFAFIISFLCDVNYSSIQGLNTIYFVSIAIIISFVAEKYFQKSFVTNMLFVAGAMSIQEILKFIFYYLTVEMDSFLLFLKIACAELLIITILSPITYFIVYSINYVFKESEQWVRKVYLLD